MIFQAMFAVITPGADHRGLRRADAFPSFCVFSLLWATLVYDPVAHWVWGDGGFLKTMGVVDFAGGTVVHINAGMAALAAALILGRRRDFPQTLHPPHNLPFAVLGAAMLWFGWFGFNAGSALGAGKLAVNAFVVTHIAGAVAGLTWALLEWVLIRRPTVLGMITGAVAGLAAITPASGFVGVRGAVCIGAGVGRGLLPGRQLRQGQARVRRLAGRLRRPRRGRGLGHVGGGPVGHQGRQPRRAQRPVLRRHLATGGPGDGRGGDGGVLVRRDVRPA